MYNAHRHIHLNATDKEIHLANQTHTQIHNIEMQIKKSKERAMKTSNNNNKQKNEIKYI